MPTVTEKDIRLDFPAEWQVVKYDGDTATDNASFYREKIERQVQNVRGVDVVCQASGTTNRLLLIELKDYRISATSAEKSTAALRQTVLQKALNTMSGLYVAARVQDPELRKVATHIFHPDLTIEVILFLERPPLPVSPRTTAAKFRRQNPQNAIENLRLDLTSTFYAFGLTFLLRSSRTMQPHDGWTVRV